MEIQQPHQRWFLRILTSPSSLCSVVKATWQAQLIWDAVASPPDVDKQLLKRKKKKRQTNPCFSSGLGWFSVPLSVKKGKKELCGFGMGCFGPKACSLAQIQGCKPATFRLLSFLTCPNTQAISDLPWRFNSWLCQLLDQWQLAEATIVWFQPGWVNRAAPHVPNLSCAPIWEQSLESQFYMTPWHSVTNKSHEPQEGYYSFMYKGDVEVTGNFPPSVGIIQTSRAERHPKHHFSKQQQIFLSKERFHKDVLEMGGFMAKQSSNARDARSFFFSECWKAFRFIKLELLMLNISKGRGGRGSLSPIQLSSSSSWLYSVGNTEHSQHLPSHQAPGTGEAQQFAGFGSLLLSPFLLSLPTFFLTWWKDWREHNS